MDPDHPPGRCTQAACAGIHGLRNGCKARLHGVKTDGQEAAHIGVNQQDHGTRQHQPAAVAKDIKPVTDMLASVLLLA